MSVRVHTVQRQASGSNAQRFFIVVNSVTLHKMGLPGRNLQRSFAVRSS